MQSVKIITGFIFNDPGILKAVMDPLSEKCGDVDSESETFSFDFTDYYNAEMGEGLKRKFVSFKKPSGLEGIHGLKSFTNGLEKRLSSNGRRRINIDPGYLDCGKLVLLTTKDYIHRIHLKENICAEVTLFFEDGTFRPWKWTYPDYRTAGYIDYFNKVRGIYARGVG